MKDMNEKSDLQRSRAISDAELLKNRKAKYIADSKGNLILHPTESQRRSMKVEQPKGKAANEKEPSEGGVEEADLQRGDMVEYRRMGRSYGLIWLDTIHRDDPNLGKVWRGQNEDHRPAYANVRDMIRIIGHDPEHNQPKPQHWPPLSHPL